MKTIMNLIRNEEGATALEYGLIAALIAAIIVVAVQAVGQGALRAFTTVGAAMP